MVYTKQPIKISHTDINIESQIDIDTKIHEKYIYAITWSIKKIIESPVDIHFHT